MSLRVRLNLLITLLFILVLLGGSSYLISNARTSVEEEMQSTAHLTLQLIEVVLANNAGSGRPDLQNSLLQHLATLETTRHLQIMVMRHGNTESRMPLQVVPPVSSDAPGWFVRLVKPPPIEFRRILSDADTPLTEILIRADPSDEISEAWDETRGVLIFLLLFIVLANLLVYFTLGRDLAPIESILTGLDRIEQGDYRLRLPRFNLPELSRIAEKFNHMAEVLLRSREENRYLTQRSMAIQENERRHLAQELHDELGQSLSAIKAVAVSMGQAGSSGDGSVKDKLDAIISFSDRMYDVAKNMMQRLRPSILDELGLLAALQEMIDSWNARHEDVFCHLQVDGDIGNLGEEIDINLYRIIQESLTNISRHANAGEVHINFLREFSRDNVNQLAVTIQDDGVGFDVTKTSRGLGLLGIKERVEALGGEYRLHTEKNKGVKIDITIPMNLEH